MQKRDRSSDEEVEETCGTDKANREILSQSDVYMPIIGNIFSI